jgi:uncharacterized protein YkwD
MQLARPLGIWREPGLRTRVGEQSEDEVKAWMRSPGHRGTLLNPTYRDIGVGFESGISGSRKADGGTFTADFGLRVRG